MGADDAVKRIRARDADELAHTRNRSMLTSRYSIKARDRPKMG
jgi:hypothetical protein